MLCSFDSFGICWIIKTLILACLKQSTSARFRATRFCLCFDWWISMHQNKNKICDLTWLDFIWAILLGTSWKSSAMVNISSRWKKASLLLNWEKSGELLQVPCRCCDNNETMSGTGSNKKDYDLQPTITVVPWNSHSKKPPVYFLVLKNTLSTTRWKFKP